SSSLLPSSSFVFFSFSPWPSSPSDPFSSPNGVLCSNSKKPWNTTSSSRYAMATVVLDTTRAIGTAPPVCHTDGMKKCRTYDDDLPAVDTRFLSPIEHTHPRPLKKYRLDLCIPSTAFTGDASRRVTHCTVTVLFSA